MNTMEVVNQYGKVEECIAIKAGSPPPTFPFTLNKLQPEIPESSICFESFAAFLDANLWT